MNSNWIILNQTVAKRTEKLIKLHPWQLIWKHWFSRRPSSVQMVMAMWMVVSLVLNWLLSICTLMRLHEGLWGSQDGGMCGSSSNRHLDFLSCWIWKLKVKLISLVKLQGLSGVLVPRRECVFMWMFRIDTSVVLLHHPGRGKESWAVFSFRGPIDFTKAPCCAHAENVCRCSNGVWSVSAGRLFFFQSAMSSGGTPEVDLQWLHQRWSLSSVRSPIRTVAWSYEN